MSVKIYAIIFGLLFILIGILGYVPPLGPEGYLLNVFTVDPFHNIFHIITGILALVVAFNAHYARMYFRVFGIIYLFLALLAFMVGSNFVYVRLNHADNLLHLIIALIYIYFGFGKPRGRKENRVAQGGVVEGNQVGHAEHVDQKIGTPTKDTVQTTETTDQSDPINRT